MYPADKLSLVLRFLVSFYSLFVGVCAHEFVKEGRHIYLLLIYVVLCLLYYENAIHDL